MSPIKSLPLTSAELQESGKQMGGRLLKKGGKSAVLHFSAESLNQMDLEEPLGLKELEAVLLH